MGNAVSPVRGGTPSPEGSNVQGSSSFWKSRDLLVQGILSIRQHKVSPHEPFQKNLFIAPQSFSQSNSVTQVTGGPKNKFRANVMVVHKLEIEFQHVTLQGRLP